MVRSGVPVNPVALPSNLDAVATPVTFTPVAVTIPLVASRVIPVPTLTTLLNVAAPSSDNIAQWMQHQSVQFHLQRN